MERVWNIAVDIFCLLFVLAAVGYAFFRSLKASEDPARLVFKWAITVGLIVAGISVLRFMPVLYWPIAAVVFSVPTGLMWAPNIGALVASPLTAMFDGGRAEPEKKPMYSYAEARRRKGQAKEAVVEVRKVLANFPHDITGALLLASIQAEDLKDLPAAERTIEEYISQPKLPPPAVAAALQNLADLQWRFGGGGAVATATLTRITKAFPETPLAHAALQRIAHLAAAEDTRRQRAAVHYTVPTGERDIGLRTGVKPAFQPPQPGNEIEQLVDQLRRHPADVESRERLAVLYAEEAGRVDLAVDQLEQLISLRAETPKRVAHWLNLLATVQARYGNDLAAAEAALRRIIERFPKSAMAETAFARLSSIGLEAKANAQTAAKSIGAYEKGIGLKGSARPGVLRGNSAA